MRRRGSVVVSVRGTEHFSLSSAALAALLAVGVSGCLRPDSGSARGDEAPPKIASSTNFVTAGNGLRVVGVDNGFALNGLLPNGFALNGFALNGFALNGFALNGMTYNGFALNGFALNGFALNGMTYNGFALNGFALNGFALNGFALNGFALNGVTYNGFALNGFALNGAQTGRLMIQYTSECALAAGECIIVPDPDDLDGDGVTSYQFCGTGEAIDPGWRDAAADPSKSVEMYSCVTSKCANDPSHPENVCGFDPVTAKTLRSILEYSTSCALPASRTIVIDDPEDVDQDGEYSWVLEGALGLAPAWETRAMNEEESKWVSACLAARTNAYGQTVLISLRADHDALRDIPLIERKQFSHLEGAFWGNVFAAEPYIRTCSGQGDGLAGRNCVGDLDSCGFTNVGSCSDGNLCGATPEGAVIGCEGETAIITVYENRNDLVANGGEQTCVRTPSGGAVCVGHEREGKLGQNVTTDPVTNTKSGWLLDARNAGLSASTYHSCARTADGSVECSGRNERQQLGAPNAAAGGADNIIRHEIAAWKHKVLRVSPSSRLTCAIESDASASCLGDFGWDSGVEIRQGCDSGGTSGYAQSSAVNVPTSGGAASVPEKLTSLGGTVVSLESGTHHSCAIAIPDSLPDGFDPNGGELYCWGANAAGQLGLGTKSDWHYTPQKVTTSASVIDVAVGGNHTCWITVNHDLFCVGSNGYGQLGQETTFVKNPRNAGCKGIVKSGRNVGWYDPSTTPLQVEGKWTDVAAGANGNCGVRADGTVACWGHGRLGELGDGGPIGYNSDGSAHVSVTPVDVLFPEGIAPLDQLVASGAATHFCTTRLDGAVYCWGDNYAGKIGRSCVGSWPDNCGNHSNVPVKFETVDTTAPCNSDGVCDAVAGESSFSCPSDCAPAPVCGDGVVSFGEDPFACPVDFCGNAIVEGIEECDDGNLDDLDGCSATCTVELCLPRLAACTSDSECCTGHCDTTQGNKCGTCGNGVVDASYEQCDDGNNVDNDGCSSICELEDSSGGGTRESGADCSDAKDGSECASGVCLKSGRGPSATYTCQ